MLRSYKEQCEKSDLWNGLTGYLAYEESDQGCKITIGAYIFDLNSNGKSNQRLNELGWLSGIPNLDDQDHYENATRNVLDAMREEGKTSDTEAKLESWKKIVDTLVKLEDLVSFSLLKKMGSTKIQAALQDPVLTHCLSARRFKYLCQDYPGILGAVSNNPNLFPFVTDKFKQDNLNISQRKGAFLFSLFPVVMTYSQPTQESHLKISN